MQRQSTGGVLQKSLSEIWQSSWENICEELRLGNISSLGKRKCFPKNFIAFFKKFDSIEHL